MDANVKKSIRQFGFAQVLVVLKDGTTASLAASAAKEPACMRQFLGGDETEALGLAAAFVGAGAAGRHRISARARRAMAVPMASRHFPHLGMALGCVDERGANRLAKDRGVAAVRSVSPLSLIRPVRVAAARASAKATWGLRALGIPALWKQGLTGEGVRVGHLDTGVDGTHPALKRCIAGFVAIDSDGKRIPGSGKNPHDSAEHGTHTVGTICGEKVDGMAIGVAPRAELYSGLVIEGGNALMRVLAGMDWSIEKRVRILNMSLGFRGYTPFFLAVVRRLRERNVLPVFAIGNEGPHTSRSPGNYPDALSVGAVGRQGTIPDFSSSITFDRPREPQQPNVVAPGVCVLSAQPGGGVQAMAGTSMATPHVAGVAALLFQAKPSATVAQVEHALQSTCDPLPGEVPQRYGYGRINPAAALQALVNGST